MSPIFTNFVRSLEAGLDPERLAAAWSTLSTVLRQELKRRGVWNAPPAYLGIFGWSTWEAPCNDNSTGASSLAEDDPVAELTAECYSFIFLDRLPALRAQLGVKANIEGLVLLNVRHFLHERQRHHDPLGFRVFERLQAAVQEGIGRGDFFVLGGDPGVRNETVIGLAPTAEPEPPARDLSELVGRWNDDLLPDLVTTPRGQQEQQVLSRLQAHLRELARAGFTSFRFREVLDPLKNDTRARWAAWLEEPGRDGELSRTAAPESAIEAHDSFVDLGLRVEAAIEAMPADRRTRRYLASLWLYLRSQANAEHAGLPTDWAALEDDEWERLSHRKLSRLLDIPRERMPDIFASLRRLVQESQTKGSGRSAPPHARLPASMPESRRHPGPAPSDLRGLS